MKPSAIQVSKALLFIYILLFFTPFLLLSVYVHPQVDDYIFTELVHKKGVWASQQLIYNNYLGRYFSNFLLSVNPLVFKSLLWYKIMPALLYLFLFHAFYFLIKSIATHKITLLNKLWFATALSSFYIIGQVSIAESFYWMAGSFTYMIANILTIYLFALFVRLNTRKHKIDFILIVALSIMIAGSNEVSLFLLTLAMGFIFLYQSFKNKRLAITPLAVLLVLVVCSMIVYLSPGNEVRKSLQATSTANNLFSAIKLTSVHSLHFIFKWLQYACVLTLFLLPAMLALINNLEATFKKILHVKLLYALAVFVILSTAGFFVGFYSVGSLLPPRALSTVYLFFTGSWFVFIITILLKLQPKMQALIIKNKFAYISIAFIGLVVVLYKPNNLRHAYADLVHKKAMQYNDELNNRDRLLSTSLKDTCVVPMVSTRPSSLYYSDMFDNPHTMFNYYYASYYQKKAIVVTGNFIPWQITRATEQLKIR